MNRKSNIQSYIFLTYLLIAFICIGSFSLFIYNYISNILTERETNFMTSMVNSFAIQVDDEFEKMDIVALNIGYSNVVSPILNDYFESNETAYEDLLNLVQLFISINGIDYKVSSINVYSLTGKNFSLGRYCNSYAVDLNSLDWVEQVNNNPRTFLISSPYPSTTSSNLSSTSTMCLSLYRVIYDSHGRIEGYVETIQTAKNIFKPLITYVNSKNSNNTAQLYVFNELGKLIYPYDPNTPVASELSTFYYEHTLTDSNSTSIINPVTNCTELMSFYQSSNTNLTYAIVQEENIILEPIYVFIKLMLLFIFIILLIVLFTSYSMSKSITRPIHQLLNAFHNTTLYTLGKTNAHTFPHSFNEFDALNESFLLMSSELKKSMNELLETRQQELKSRSLALQSQINPHFYYNSFASIMILAENDKTPEIIRFSKSLTDMMRYITNGSMQIVTLNSEMSYVQKYLYCLKIRHQSSLEYSIDIDPSLDKLNMPKLLIQPLVENAIKYGTECSPPWKVSIYSEIKENIWLIHIKDNGPGFSHEALDLLSKRIQQADETIGLPEMNINGLGLLNVYSRWKLFCKHNFIFKYGNSPDGGGMVTIGGELKDEE